ncbi:MAG: hypothetical protein WBO77_00175 [Microgenomates group bacterium]
MDKETLPYAHSIAESLTEYPPAVGFPEGVSVTKFLDAQYSLNQMDSEEDGPISMKDFSAASRIVNAPDGLATYALLLEYAKGSAISDKRLANFTSFGIYEDLVRIAIADKLGEQNRTLNSRLDVFSRNRHPFGATGTSRLPQVTMPSSEVTKLSSEIRRNARIIDQLNRRTQPTSLESGQE